MSKHLVMARNFINAQRDELNPFDADIQNRMKRIEKLDIELMIKMKNEMEQQLVIMRVNSPVRKVLLAMMHEVSVQEKNYLTLIEDETTRL